MRESRNRKSFRMFLQVAAVAVCLILVTANVAHATTYACTPGFWKNHTSEWVGYSTNTLLTSVFTGVPSELSGDTLLDALQYGGGNTLVEKQQILLRAAVALLLNVSNPALGWSFVPLTAQNVIDLTNLVLAWTYLPAVVAQAASFDFMNNNQLGCPLPLPQ